MKEVNIREAESKDYEKLMKLYNAFVGDDRYKSKDDDSFDEVLASDKNFVYVAEDKGNLVGFVTFSVRIVIRYPKQIAEMDELYVVPAYRRKKLGTKLVEAVLKKASELRCYRMFIETHYEKKGAHELYDRLGFTNYGYHFIKDL